MKERPDGNIFMLCFENAEDYLKCDRGVLVQYRRFLMKVYYKRSEEEVMAHKERKARLELEAKARTKRSKANNDSRKSSAGTLSADRNQAEALSNY